VDATLEGETRSSEIVIWLSDEKAPPGTVNWGTHPIGREVGDIAAVPTEGGPNLFSLEQTPSGRTYLRGVRDDGIQIWNWLMPEATRDVELVCGDWLGGALISANRPDSYTLYAVGKDGKLRWQRTLPGLRKAHAYNLQHTVHVLSQFADGTNARITALDEISGDLKFELPVPGSREEFINVRKAGTKLLCAKGTTTIPLRTSTSRMFVSQDGFAYAAFSQRERTFETKSCAIGSEIAPRDVTMGFNDQVVLWQINADGIHRSTTVENAVGHRLLSEPIADSAPTGGIIPDGPEGVLLAIRKSSGVLGVGADSLREEFIYRLGPDGKVIYKFSVPAFEGPLHDDMVLGESDRGFATRGGLLIAFDVQTGKELWRWNSDEREVEVLLALADGSCLVQTPVAVFKVDDAATSHKVMEGRVMIDWQGQMYRKH
jgi:outer membrane protein assembly factor BamB